MNFIFLLLFFEIAFFFLAFFLSGNDIMAPSVVMCIMFILSTVFAIYANIELEIDFSPKSCFILVSGIFTFIVSEAMFRSIFEQNAQKKYLRIIKSQQLRPFLIDRVQNCMIWFLVFFNVLIIALYYQGVSEVAGSAGLIALTAFRQIAGHNLEDRLINVWVTQFSKIVTASGYIAMYIYLQRRLAGKKKERQNALLLLIVILSQIIGFLGAARTSVLRFLSAALIMYYILWHQKNGWNRNLSWRYVRIGLMCIIIGIPAFYYSLLLVGRETTLNIFDYITVYIGNPILLFDAYIKKPMPLMSFGEETLANITSFLNRVFGLDIYIRDINLEFREKISGNVYTFFRRPLHDFGYGGMIIFTVLVAFLFSWIYYKKIKWRPCSRKVSCWVLTYGYLFYWIIGSSILQVGVLYISFTSISTMIIMIMLYLLMTKVRFVSRGSHSKAIVSKYRSNVTSLRRSL